MSKPNHLSVSQSIGGEKGTETVAVEGSAVWWPGSHRRTGKIQETQWSKQETAIALLRLIPIHIIETNTCGKAVTYCCGILLTMTSFLKPQKMENCITFCSTVSQVSIEQVLRGWLAPPKDRLPTSNRPIALSKLSTLVLMDIM